MPAGKENPCGAGKSLTNKGFPEKYGNSLKFGGKILEIYRTFTHPRHKPSRNREEAA
jgi:hypothetical protein